MKTFEERLVQFFEEQDIVDVDLQEAIKKGIGKPSGDLDTILENHDLTREDEEYTYDADFESVLENFHNLFTEENAVELVHRAFGYYGSYSFYVTESLEGVAITNN